MEEISGLLSMLVVQPGVKIMEDVVVVAEAGEEGEATQGQEAVEDAPEAGAVDVVTAPEIGPETAGTDPDLETAGTNPDLGTEEAPGIGEGLPPSRGAAVTEA